MDTVRSSPGQPSRGLDALNEEIAGCTRCPRLVAWREQVAVDRRPSNAGEQYWGRPLPGFGDADAGLLVVGLAPAAHGGNRTGRMFTGDRSGDFLFSALHRAGYANQPESIAREDGLVLTGVYVTAAVRCAPPSNKPAPDERDACSSYLAEELALLVSVRVIVALGGFALDALWRLPGAGGGRRRMRFAHGAEARLEDGRTIVCSFHPSQRNVFTGLLTPAMMDAIFVRVRSLGG